MNDQPSRSSRGRSSRSPKPSKAERRALIKVGSDHNRPLVTERKEWEAVKAGLIAELEDGLTMRSVSLERGSVRFSELSSTETLPAISAVSQTAEHGFALQWESFTQLDADHGLLVINSILREAGLTNLPPPELDELIEEIRLKVGPKRWSEIGACLTSIDKLGQDREALIVAVWTDLFVEKLSDVWLAAMAQYAYYVKEADYAFGYLTAQLNRRQEFELHFIRGKKIVENARMGGHTKASRSARTTDGVLREMRQLVANGMKVGKAAELAFRKGKGTSPGANVRLFNRHRDPKSRT
jgi:hypothetical protein